MEVEGSTAVDVQDASFLKKDAIVIEDASDAVESSKVSAEEAVEKEADCSSVVVGSISNLENVEKDDLLQRIEEVCNDKRASVERSEGISNASEHEFLKKAEMKNLNLRTAIDLVDDEADAISDECKDNISSQGPEYDGFSDNGSSSNGDAVVINDKVIVVKDDTSEDSRPISLSSSDDAVEAVSETSQNVTIKKSANKIDDGALNKDSAVTSSTTKSDDNIICIDDTEETLIELPESSTGNQKIKISEKEEEKVVPINIESSANDGEMEVDNIDEVVSESMDMDAKASSPSNNNMDTGNEATSKSNEKISDGDDIEMIDLEAVPSTEGIQQPSAEIDQSTQSIEKKGDGAVLDEKSVLPAPSVVNHNIKDKPEANEAKEATKSENKPLVDLKLKDNVVSSSLSNTPVSSSNVCKTPSIPKKFEQSEIVNKISDASEVGKDQQATSSKQVDKTSGDPTTKSEICATSETDAPSSDGTLNKYIDVMKKYNGIADTTTDEEDVATPVKRVVIPENKSEGNKTQMSETHLAKDSIYEVRLCSEKNDVRYLSIERIEGPNKRENSNADKTATSDNSVQSSSNGSVSNLPVFPLPQSHGAQSSASSSSLHGHTSSATQNKHTIHGIEELCTFMINQFTKIKQAVNPDFKTEVVPSTPTPTSYKSSSTTTTPQSAVQTPSKSAQQNKRNKKNNSPASETPSASASAPKSGRSRKRSFHPDDSDSATPKTKQVKRDLNKESPKVDEATTTNDDGNPGSCVLAKWVDKKFYAGRITGEKPGNKYSVLFEDGASKILPKESIVFGEGDILPLLDHQVYAFVEDGYECGTVCSIEKSNKVLYEVKTESATVKVTASEIYLEGHQAKEIQKLQNVKTSESVEEEEISGTRPSRNKRPHASPNTTEAGCSSAAGKRGKRQKRYS